MSEPENPSESDPPERERPAGGPSGEPEPGAHELRSRRGPRSFGDRLILTLVVIVVLAVGIALAVALLPDWWARRVADVADGSRVAGTFSGLTCGVVFTAIPLLLLRPVVGRRGGWRRRAAFLLLAVVVAVPNLTTLGITIGGDAVRPARLVCDLEAPGFRGAVLGGAVLAVVALVFGWTLLVGGRRRSAEVTRLRGEVRRLEENSPEKSTES